MENMQSHIISSLCYSLGLEQSMKILLKSMKEFIPLEYFIVFIFSEKYMYNFQLVEISDNGRQIDKMRIFGVNMDKTLEPFKSGQFEDDVYIIGDVQQIPELKNHFSATSSRNQHSLMVIKFFKKEDVSFCLSCRTEEKNVYTVEHARLLHSLKDVLVHLLWDVINTTDVEGIPQPRPYAIFLEDEYSLLSACPDMSGIVRQVDKVARSNAPVLLLGETGVGKELVAGAIHSRSNRQRQPMVRVNCGAIPETLLDAEFFGYEKGAFTGAVGMHKGYFEQANGGTLFLDEVSELSPLAQTHLLRALDLQEIRRIGSQQPIRLNFRLIAASNRNLEQMVEEGAFRADLWYRLYGVLINIPPLRSRVSDIPVLLQHFMTKAAVELELESLPPCSRRLQQHLMSRPWPGNVRELRNWVLRAMIHTAGENSQILLPPLEDELNKENARALLLPSVTQRQGAPVTLKEMERAYVKWVLEHCGNRIQGPKGAAAALDLHPATLRSKMHKLGIPLPTSLK